MARTASLLPALMWQQLVEPHRLLDVTGIKLISRLPPK